MGWEGSGEYVCGFLLLIQDRQNYIDQLVKIPNETSYIPWSRD